MDKLNPKQLSIILDWPVDRALYVFINKTGETTTIEDDDREKLWFVDIGILERAIGLPIRKLITDVQSNFTHNKACMEYVMKKISVKIKPGKKGLYPLVVKIPSDVDFLLTHEQREKIIGMVSEYLPGEQIRLIQKHKIRIV